jgi:6-pyruvoyltetrahydropterin/6-carboxytetrahydropterin synthase
MIIGKKFTFAASHQLWRQDWLEAKNREVFGRCSRLHGHNYYVEIELEGKVQEDDGMVLNYYELGDIIKVLDHRHLNDILPTLPTAENLSLFIGNLVDKKIAEKGNTDARCLRVLVKETDSSFAVYMA